MRARVLAAVSLALLCACGGGGYAATGTLQLGGHCGKRGCPSPSPLPSVSPSPLGSPSPSPLPSPSPASRPGPSPSPHPSPSPTGCTVFPADSIFNRDVSSMPVNSQSANWLKSMNAATTNLHPDFGAYPYGIPYNTVSSAHATGSVSFQYASESDPNPYVVGADLKIEGTPGDGGDDHMLAYNPGACTLQEIYQAHLSNQPYTGGSGAKWNLASDALRPDGWTSADAAGLPIFPLLVRYSEVQAGFIGHAIRFTVHCTDTAHVWPARHDAGTCGTNSNLPPMGARFRLKSSFNISSFNPQAQVILRALQHYGMLVADNGSDWYFQGDENPGWTDSLLSELKTVPAGQFEAVDESSLQVAANSGQSR